MREVGLSCSLQSGMLNLGRRVNHSSPACTRRDFRKPSSNIGSWISIYMMHLEAAMSSQPLLGCQGKTLSTQDESCELRFHHAPRMPCELLFNQLASYKLRCGLQG